jgi:hypothetical protein
MYEMGLTILPLKGNLKYGSPPLFPPKTQVF